MSGVVHCYGSSAYALLCPFVHIQALRTKLEEAQAVAAAEAAAALRQRRGSGGGKGRARDEAATQQIEGASAGGISGSALPLWVVLFVAIMCN